MNAEELQPARKVPAASNRGRRHGFLECRGFLDSFGALSLRLPRQPKANIIVHLVMMTTLVTVTSATTICMVCTVLGLKMTATMPCRFECSSAQSLGLYMFVMMLAAHDSGGRRDGDDQDSDGVHDDACDGYDLPAPCAPQSDAFSRSFIM